MLAASFDVHIFSVNVIYSTVVATCLCCNMFVLNSLLHMRLVQDDGKLCHFPEDVKFAVVKTFLICTCNRVKVWAPSTGLLYHYTATQSANKILNLKGSGYKLGNRRNIDCPRK